MRPLFCLFFVVATSACPGIVEDPSDGGSPAADSGSGGSGDIGGGRGGGNVGGGSGGGNVGGGSGGGNVGGGSGGGNVGGGGGGNVGGGSGGGNVGGGSGGGNVGGGTGVLGLDARPSNPLVGGCVAPTPPPTSAGVATERAFPNLTFNAPLGLHSPGDGGIIFVQERAGMLRSFPNQNNAMPATVKEVLNLTAKVDDLGEGGFLGVAFHPQWPTRLEVFLSYTETGSGSNPLRTIVSRYKSLDSGATLDPASEERLLVINQPYTNHKGGHISFGPDGFLYIGLGDGGSGGDPQNHGQRLNTNLGKMLRIDVDVPFSQKYAIPPTNPYAADNTPCNRGSTDTDAASGVRCAEIYAYGFRNPWRWNFDRVSGELWVADVGQGAWEEVDRVVLGGNYGWNTREGAHCYPPNSACSSAGLIDPVVEYGRTIGNSTTGGYVYRGSALPTLVGKFVFGDYGTGRIFSVEPTAQGSSALKQLLDTTFSIASFAQLANNEIYALDIATGQVHRLVPSGPVPPDDFPQLLSQTGCFQQDDPTVPLPALVPYDVNAELWSDGATKERYLAIPDGTTITVEPSGDFTFPNGTVLAKTFRLGGKRVETRLFMRHLDGEWAGYTYEWNDAQTQATLLPASKTRTEGSQTWYYPSRGQCLQCHTAIAGRALGPEIGQLNSDMLYPSTGRTANQLETLAGLGFFSAPLSGPVSSLQKIEDPFGTGPLDARARAWLHANCAGCHQQNAGQGPSDWRYSLSFQKTNSCNVPPQNGNLGIAGAMHISPGSTAKSIVSRRIHALNSFRMPPVASSQVDVQGSALIDEWINSITSCPP